MDFLNKSSVPLCLLFVLHKKRLMEFACRSGFVDILVVFNKLHLPALCPEKKGKQSMSIIARQDKSIFVERG